MIVVDIMLLVFKIKICEHFESFEELSFESFFYCQFFLIQILACYVQKFKALTNI